MAYGKQNVPSLQDALKAFKKKSLKVLEIFSKPLKYKTLETSEYALTLVINKTQRNSEILSNPSKMKHF